MKKSLVIASILSVSLVAAVGAKVTAPNQLSSADKKFLLSTAQDGMTEVKLGEIGEKNAYNQKVKDFAAKMVEDHSKANASLKRLAATKGITLPEELDNKHKTTVNKFSTLRGSNFDRNYIQQMLKGHKEVIASLEIEKQKGESDLKNWCKDTLPTIKEHLKIAEDVNRDLQAR